MPVTADTPRITLTGSMPAITIHLATGSAGGGGGVTVHNELTGRSAATAHPISAITGLQDALDAAGGGAVDSVNGETGTVVLDAADVGAIATSARGNSNGVASLDGDGTVPDIQLPSSIARDSEIGTQISAHDGSGTAHADIRALIPDSPGDIGAEVAGAAAAAQAAAIAASQPLDSDLTAIAALTTTSYGRAFLALVDAAAGRTALGLGTASQSASGDFQPSDSDLTAIAALATTTYGRSLLTLADAAAARTALELGTAATTAASAYATAAQGVLAGTALQPGSAGYLAAVAYNPSLQNVLSTTSDADVDASNLAITFTTPPSGKVLVELSAMARRETASQYLSWSLRESTTTIQTQAVSLEFTAETRATAKFLVTGLTPASAHTYKWGHSSVSGGSGRTKYGGAAGAAVMTVAAVP